jgi:hypothetical protein
MARKTSDEPISVSDGKFQGRVRYIRWREYFHIDQNIDGLVELIELIESSPRSDIDQSYFQRDTNSP